MPSAAVWSGSPSIKGSSESVKMAFLTLSLIGIQFTWGLEMTYCTPYLLELGLTKSMVSLVWIAGPLSGLVMQPIVGVIADRSKSPYGRRRPFMAGGAAIVTVALFVLGWTKEIIYQLVPNESFRKQCTILLAVLSIYAIDFAINAVQASCRSLIIDTLPINKQHLGSAWASRMVAVGHLIGYGAGAVDLKMFFGDAIGSTQFKQLTVVSAVGLCITVGLTCWAVTEKVLIDDGKGENEKISPLAMLRQIFSTATSLPPRIAAICRVQFWCWIGWFPFLFYSTTWVGEIYLRYNATPDQREHPDTLGQVGRVGSMSLIVFSIVTFASSIMLPWFVRTPEQEERTPQFTPRPPESLKGLLELAKWRPTLLQGWTYSHLIFAGTMICAPYVQSLKAATVLVAFCGIPWAFNCWAPFTFMGIEINKLSNPNSAHHRRHHSTSTSIDLDQEPKPNLLSSEANDSSSSSSAVAPAGNSSELAGVYLGILNLYCTLPQFIGTFISWIVFSILEPGKSPELAKEAHPDEHHGTDGPNAIAVCLFIGALAAVGASYATRKLRDAQ